MLGAVPRLNILPYPAFTWRGPFLFFDRESEGHIEPISRAPHRRGFHQKSPGRETIAGVVLLSRCVVFISLITLGTGRLIDGIGDQEPSPDRVLLCSL